MSKEKNNEKKIAIFIITICILFILGMAFYKTCSFSEEIPEEKPIETVKEKEPKPSVKPPKSVIVEPDTVSEQEIDSIATIENPEIENGGIVEEKPETVVPEPVEKQKELSNIYIPFTKSLFNRPNLSINDLPERKIYYSGENGRLESSFVLKEGKTIEYLVSYNPQGEKVDNLEIGLIDEKAVRKKYATFSQNKISTFETIQGKEKEKEEESVTNYSITPELRFVKGKTYKKIL
jgi:hypothetical protein